MPRCARAIDVMPSMACMCRNKCEVACCHMCGCGIEQKPGKGRARLYCKPCAKSRANVGPRQATCFYCGKVWVKSGRGVTPKWCSPQCRNKADYQTRARVVKCQTCGSEFASAAGNARLCASCRHHRPCSGWAVDCKTCGKAFYRPPSGKQEYCSRPCLWYAMRCGSLKSTEDWIDNEAAQSASVVRYFGVTCKGCGRAVTRVLRRGPNGKRQAIRGSKADTKSWCSRQCRFDYLKARTAAKLLCRLIARLIRTVLVGNPECTVCGDAVPWGRTSTCSKECCRERGRQRSRQTYESLTGVRLRPASGDRPCRLCSRKITPDVALGRGRSVCDYCNLHRRTFKSRAIMYGVKYEHVSRAAVFRRDGWRCQLCSKKVLRKAKRNRHTKRLHPRTASLDHIIPMSKGGDHVEANVQCACLACNVRKNANIIGQLRFF